MKCICEILKKYLQEYVNPIICVPEDLTEAPILGKYGRPLDGKSDKYVLPWGKNIGYPIKNLFRGFEVIF